MLRRASGIVCSFWTVCGAIKLPEKVNFVAWDISFNAACNLLGESFFIIAVPFKTARWARRDASMDSSILSSVWPVEIWNSSPSANFTLHYKPSLNLSVLTREKVLFLKPFLSPDSILLVSNLVLLKEPVAARSFSNVSGSSFFLTFRTRLTITKMVACYFCLLWRIKTDQCFVQF